MGTTLVDNQTNVTSKVSVLNPFPYAVRLRQDSIVGCAEPINETPVVLAEEEDSDLRDNTNIRRISFQKLEDPHLSSRRNDGKAMPKTIINSHPKDLFEKITTEGWDKDMATIANLLIRYQDVFSKDEWDLVCTHLTEHSINTGTAAPINQPPRKVPMAYADEDRKAVDKPLEQKVVRKSTSPWVSPFVLVKKKNGSIRPCIDYRKLANPDAFPLPRIQDCLDASSGSATFGARPDCEGMCQAGFKQFHCTMGLPTFYTH